MTATTTAPRHASQRARTAGAGYELSLAELFLQIPGHRVVIIKYFTFNFALLCVETKNKLNDFHLTFHFNH